MTPELPVFPFWDSIATRRKLVDLKDRKKWTLPDRRHYMELTIASTFVHMRVVSEGYEETVIEHKVPLLDRKGHELLNIAAVLAEKKFCEEELFFNKHASGN